MILYIKLRGESIFKIGGVQIRHVYPTWEDHVVDGGKDCWCKPRYSYYDQARNDWYDDVRDVTRNHVVIHNISSERN